jgi:polar amino acid transport system substrate-binding protein
MLIRALLAVATLRTILGSGAKSSLIGIKDTFNHHQAHSSAHASTLGAPHPHPGPPMRTPALLFAVALLAACATAPEQAPPELTDLAPTGTLRAAINFGNPILATRDAAGHPRGVSVDLARTLGARLGVGVEFVLFESAGKVVDAARSGAWDVAFVAVDPARGQDMLQTAPYVLIEGAYLVKASSPIRSNDEVDRAGLRIAVGKGSAYDLYLGRTLKHAQLVHAPTSPAVTDLFLAQNLDVAAGVKQQLQADAKRLPGLRLLDGRFMVIEQAMATPKGRDAGARYLNDFVETMKRSGAVAQALARHGIEGASVAPAAQNR